MKKLFTRLDHFHIIIFVSLLSALQIPLSGQTTHSVEVTSNVFTPSEITINVGDTVVWTNTEGSHNVNGQTATFPSNPESFGNDVAQDWVFSHVFSIAGVYDYHCNPHAAFGMVGKVTVNEIVASVVQLKNLDGDLSIYPNPATDKLFIASDRMIESISLYDVAGSRVLDYRNLSSHELEISVENLSPGVYFVESRSVDQISQISRLIKR